MRPSRIFSVCSFCASARFCLRSFLRSFFVSISGITTGLSDSARARAVKISPEHGQLGGSRLKVQGYLEVGAVWDVQSMHSAIHISSPLPQECSHRWTKTRHNWKYDSVSVKQCHSTSVHYYSGVSVYHSTSVHYYSSVSVCHSTSVSVHYCRTGFYNDRNVSV